MKRIKISLVIALMIISLNSWGQVEWGIKGGVNLDNMKFDIDRKIGVDPNTKDKFGFHVGVIADIPFLASSFSFQPSILYNNKGYSSDVEDLLVGIYNTDVDDVRGYNRYNYHYLEIPLNFAYHYYDVQFTAGPYFAFGLGGKLKHDFDFEVGDKNYDSDDVYSEEQYRLKPIWGEVDDDVYKDYLEEDNVSHLYRAFDFGLNFGLGYRRNDILLSTSYSMGITNMTPRYDAPQYNMEKQYTEGYIQKNRVLTFSVSYFIK